MNTWERLFGESLNEGVHDFDGFLWDNEGVDLNVTHSICRFPLREGDSVSESREMHGSMKENFCDEVDQVINLLSEVLSESRMNESVEVNEEYRIEIEEMNETGVSENGQYIGPRTRSRGPVQEHDWIMKKAL